MTPEQMAEQIVSFVKAHPGSSFVELMRLIGPEAQGDFSMYYDGNVKVWEGMSSAFTAALRLAERHIEPRPSQVLTYLIDGAVLNLPIATRLPPNGGFKKPRWLPVTYYMRGTENKVGRPPAQSDRPVSR